jgi:hypothetical protein
MGIIRLLMAPVRSIVRFPLFQLAVVVALILFLQAADDKSARGQFNGLDELVESTVALFSAAFNVKSFTKSWLTTGFWIAYVAKRPSASVPKREVSGQFGSKLVDGALEAVVTKSE